MSAGDSRIARFVRAARALLVTQALAALLATLVAIWAFVEVRGVIAERDDLRLRIAELEAQAPANAAAQAPLPVPPATPLPDYNSALPAEAFAPPVAPQLTPDQLNLLLRQGPYSQPPPAEPEALPPPPQTTAPERPQSRWNLQRSRPPEETRPAPPPDDLTPQGPALGPQGNVQPPRP